MGVKRLCVGYLPTLYHTSFLLIASALLTNRELDVKWTLFPSGPDLVNAMGEGRINVGYVGLPPVIIGIDRGIGLTCIAGGHVEGTLMIAREDVQPIDQCSSMAEFLAQLSGRVIGCPPRGSIHDVIINDLLSRYRIDDIQVKNYAWADFLPDALVETEIAAAVGTPALAVLARRYYGARIVLPPARLWPFNPSYGIVVMREELASLENPLRRFLVAHEIACEKIRHDLPECARIVARKTGVVDAGFVTEAYKVSPKYCAALPSEYVASTMKFVNVLKTLGYISRGVNEADLFSKSLISQVHPEAPHYQHALIAPSHKKMTQS
jgi:NitT/TauT family transport system substrate-binding protein